MELIEGRIPEEAVWRVLALISPGRLPGIHWSLAHQLAKVNGELVTAILVTDDDPKAIELASRTLEFARQMADEDCPHHPIIVRLSRERKGLEQLVLEADIDLVIASADAVEWQRLDHLPCTIAAMRGQAVNNLPLPDSPEEAALVPIRSILVPTAGGPNATEALNHLLQLTPEVRVKAIYVARESMGANAVAMGRQRLRQVISFVDGNDRIESEVVEAETPVAGITKVAMEEDFQVVLLGASRESSLDRVVFGDVVGSVVRNSEKPVLVVRQGTNRLRNIASEIAWGLQQIIPRKPLAERTQIYARVRRSARPNIDFYILITLSAGIAALGLMLNSPAVIIGAMLVAPLLSSMLGSGMAIVLGDARFLRLSLGTVVRGVALSLLISTLIGLLRYNVPLTPEVLTRTAPTLLDLGVALLAGMAGAYALCESDALAALPGVAIAAALVPPISSAGIAFSHGEIAAGLGAMLLFSANFVSISSAAVIVFLALGFRPRIERKERRQIQGRTVRIAALSLMLVALLLAYTTYSLAREATEESRVWDVTESRVGEIPGAELADLQFGSLGDNILELEVTARSTESISFAEVVELQENIGIDLQREVALNLTVVRVTRLDPVIPPTFTATPTETNTATPGPTPTSTPSATIFPTDTPSVTPTDTATPLPSATHTATPTEQATNTPSSTETSTQTPTAIPATATVNNIYGVNMRAEPDTAADILHYLPPETAVILLPGQEEAEGRLWQAILYQGDTGWVAAEFLDLPD